MPFTDVMNRLASIKLGAYFNDRTGCESIIDYFVINDKKSARNSEVLDHDILNFSDHRPTAAVVGRIWKVNVDLYSEGAQRRSGMARILKGSHSFTYTPRVHPLTE